MHINFPWFCKCTLHISELSQKALWLYQLMKLKVWGVKVWDGNVTVYVWWWNRGLLSVYDSLTAGLHITSTPENTTYKISAYSIYSSDSAVVKCASEPRMVYSTQRRFEKIKYQSVNVKILTFILTDYRRCDLHTAYYTWMPHGVYVFDGGKSGTRRKMSSSQARRIRSAVAGASSWKDAGSTPASRRADRIASWDRNV